MTTLRVHTFPAFSSRLECWEAVLEEDGGFEISAKWGYGDSRKTLEHRHELPLEIAHRWMEELTRLIPVGTTQVFEAADIGGYHLEVITRHGSHKWADGGIIDYIRQDDRTRAINSVFRQIEAEVRKLLEPIGFPGSRKKRKKKR